MISSCSHLDLFDFISWNIKTNSLQQTRRTKCLVLSEEKMSNKKKSLTSLFSNDSTPNTDKVHSILVNQILNRFLLFNFLKLIAFLDFVFYFKTFHCNLF